MTWWYRWLCRLSGVLGAICEYRSGRGAAPPPTAHARLRAGTLGRGSAGHARPARGGGVAQRRPGGCHGYRPRPGLLGFRLGWRLWGPSRREPELGGSAGLDAAPARGDSAPVSESALRLLAERRWPGPRRPHLLTWVRVGAQPSSPLGEGCLRAGRCFLRPAVERTGGW